MVRRPQCGQYAPGAGHRAATVVFRSRRAISDLWTNASATATAHPVPGSPGRPDSWALGDWGASIYGAQGAHRTPLNSLVRAAEILRKKP